MATSEDKDINQTVRVEGEVNAYKVNEGFRKFSEWWSRLKAAVKINNAGGGNFIANAGGASTPSYRFIQASDTGFWLDPTNNTIRYSRDGSDFGELTGNGFVAHVSRSSNLSIPLATWVTITWQTELELNKEGIWNSSDPTKLTVPVDGVYLISTTGRTLGGTVGNRYLLDIQKNGTTIKRSEHYGFNTNWPSMSVEAINLAVEGDYYTVRIFQQAGSPLPFAAANSSFQLMRIG